MTSSHLAEPILEPDLPIIDAHHHLWLQPEFVLAALEQNAQSAAARSMAAMFRRRARYLLDEYLADVNSGHDIRATVYMEVNSMYRSSGPEALRSIGEVEFANGIAAIAASGVMTDIKMCAGIVSYVDLQLGDAVEEILLAHIQAGGGRLRGVRGKHLPQSAQEHMPGNFGLITDLLLDRRFCAGFRHLAEHGLSYDTWQLEYQLPDVAALAHAFPNTQIIVDHLGGLYDIGTDDNAKKEHFTAWSNNIFALAKCPNVAMKLGGLGMPSVGLRTSFSATPPSSLELAEEWRPYIETCIEAFGVTRCMFESNFPVDAATTTYPVLWNAFKRIVSSASADEKAALFSGTAARIYRIDI